MTNAPSHQPMHGGAGAQQPNLCLLEHTVSSWRELRDLLEDLAEAGWVFRGQAAIDWPLECSLTRYLKIFHVPQSEWHHRESKILHNFKRKAHLLLHQVPDQRHTLDWLALLQHHGAPTRLLDFTWSPYVAAFFALERASSDAAIWAVVAGSEIHNDRGWHISEVLNGVTQLYNPSTFGDREFVRTEPTASVPRLFMGEPVLMNQRMTTQAGTFLIPTLDIESPLETQIPHGSVVRIRLHTSALRAETMSRLYNMNISNASLFPGIDGLARSLAYELEHIWTLDADAGRRLSD